MNAAEQVGSIRMVTTSDRMAAEPKRLSVEDAAAFLGVSKDFVYRKSASGEITSYKIGKRLEFAEADLVAFRESRKRGGAR